MGRGKSSRHKMAKNIKAPATGRTSEPFIFHNDFINYQMAARNRRCFRARRQAPSARRVWSLAAPGGSLAFPGLVLAVIAAAEIFLEPDVEADKEITAAHFLDFQLGLAGAAIAPGDGDHRPT